MTGPAIAGEPGAHHRDLAKIRQVFDDLQQGFNDGDPAALARHLAADPVAVNSFGIAIEGAEHLTSAQAAGLSRLLTGERACYDPVDVRFLRPDVAVVRVDVRPTPGAPPASTGLWVLVERDGAWRVAATQSTVCAP